MRFRVAINSSITNPPSANLKQNYIKCLISKLALTEIVEDLWRTFAVANNILIFTMHITCYTAVYLAGV